MFSRQVLQNLIVFLNRAPVTGQESVAWLEAFSAIQNALNPPPAPVATNDTTSNG